MLSASKWTYGKREHPKIMGLSNSPDRRCLLSYPYSNNSPYFTIMQIIFHFLWNYCAHCGKFENVVLLMYTLEGVSSVANLITAYEESQ